MAAILKRYSIELLADYSEIEVSQKVSQSQWMGNNKSGTQVKRSLAISSWGDAAIWLLDPGEQDAQGEWAGGCWASWNPGMEWRATSFAQLMERELEDFIRLRDDEE